MCLHCKGNSVYIFLFWELRGFSPNFYIHVSVSDIFPGSVHIFPPAETAAPSWEYIIHSQTHECGMGLRPRYSFSRNICFQFSKFFLCVSDLYILTIDLPILPQDRSWEYINRLQSHECGNWDWGRAVPRQGIHKWDFRFSAELRYMEDLDNVLIKENGGDYAQGWSSEKGS
jgi:hypothetical protein